MRSAQAGNATTEGGRPSSSRTSSTVTPFGGARLLGLHRRIEARADVREDVPGRGSEHLRGDRSAADSDPHAQLHRSGERRRASSVRHEGDDVRGRAARLLPGIRRLERRRDGIPAEGERISAVISDGVERTADRAADQLPELLGAGRPVQSQPLGEARKAGQIGEQRHGVSGDRPGGGREGLTTRDSGQVCRQRGEPSI